MFKKKFKSSSLIAQLQKPSQQIACIHLDETQQEVARISFTELDKKARAVAVYLQTMMQIGDRVLLVYPAGIDFIVALVGCLYAGIIAVPVSHDVLQENNDSINAIARDANIAGILTVKNYFQVIQNKCQALLSTRKSFVIDTEDLNFEMAEKYQLPAIDDETIAYLQYTPSSALTPKGVVVRHKNLNHSLKFSAQVWRYSKKSVTCNALPHSDTQGLILGLLVPLYTGTTTITLPTDVLKKQPLWWLQTISQYHVTHSGALNSDYDRCVKEIEDEDRKNLKLKTWKIAFNTGENVSYETLNAFNKKFLICGFHPNYFSSTYLLAEAVGIVSVTAFQKNPTVFNLNTEAIKRNDVIITHKNIPHRKFIGNGHLLPGLDAVVMDSENKFPLKEGKIGEIWLSGESIVDEYWHMSDPHLFSITIPGVKGKFFRTGDIGFIKNGEICLVGRVDEMLTFTGKKYYPLDLESTVAVALRSSPVSERAAVFSLPMDGNDVGVFLQEVRHGQVDAMLEEIIRNTRRALIQRHGLDLYDVVLVKENSLPTSSSGKIQYGLCRQQFLNNTLSVLTSYRIKLAAKKTEIPIAKPIKTSKPKIKSHDLSGVAVIGMSGVFPGANNLNQFWENLLQGKNPITSIPSDRWSWKDYFGEAQVEKQNTDIKWGCFVDEISQFDANFFNISAREAELMDPQQRLFLQTAYAAIEDAGYAWQQLSEKQVGVFVGASNHEYAELLHDVADVFAKTGLSHAMIANRVSQFFNLKGPSEVVDTGESSSLVALYHAVRSIKTGECDVAIVGGVNALLSPTAYLNQSRAGLLSTDGTPRVFDKDADGYVRGEGVGIIILKSLAKAYDDGDHIYGVIKNIVSLCGTSMADMVIKASKQADISLDTLSYIETNAAGCVDQDINEINALKQAFSSAKNAHCGLGSVKSNIGHLEAAAGVAGFIKVLLAMKYKQIPGNLHFNVAHSQMELENSPFYILDKARPWLRLTNAENEDIPRRAGINSLSRGGVNVHALLEEFALERDENVADKQTYLITLSARTENELRQRIVDLHDWLLVQHEVPSLPSVSYTLNTGRQHFDKRCALVADSITELQVSLLALLNNQEPDNAVLNFQGNKKTKWRPIFQTLYEQLMQDITASQILSASEYKNKLLAVGNFYTEGYEIQWHELYKVKPHRVSLPSYPFTKKSYWVPDRAEVLVFNEPLQNSILR